MTPPTLPSGTLQVGFRDIVGYSVGVAVPMLVLVTALLIAIFVGVGIGAGPGITAGMMAGLILALALEMFRRHLLQSRLAGGRLAVKAFRGLVWAELIGGPAVTLLVAAGVFSGCYGHGCDTLSRVVMNGMLGLCLFTLLLLPLGYRLLKQAIWLQLPG